MDHTRSYYDFRHFTSREKGFVLEVGDEAITRMVEENPNLNEDTIREVVDAINWDALADPVGTVRVSPSGKWMAIRIPSIRTPWEVINLDGKGGSTSCYEYHKWPKKWDPDSA